MTRQTYSPGTNSALVRLRFAKRFEHDDVLRGLLDRNEGLLETAEIVLSKLKSGEHFAYDNLVKLIVATRESSLFAQAREQLFQSNWALLDLYKGRYPDRDIESRLCESLWHSRSDDSDWLRLGIVEAMGQVGSEMVLPILEAIQFDMGPKARVGQLARELFPESSNGPLELLSQAQFLQAVSAAIDAIRSRMKESPA